MTKEINKEQIHLILTMFLLQQEGKTLEEMFNWIKFDREEYIGIKKLLLTTPIRKENIECKFVIGIFGYWEIQFSLKLDRIEKLECITASSYVGFKNNILIGIYIQLFNTYRIQVEDIIKRINFKDTV